MNWLDWHDSKLCPPITHTHTDMKNPQKCNCSQKSCKYRSLSQIITFPPFVTSLLRPGMSKNALTRTSRDSTIPLVGERVRDANYRVSVKLQMTGFKPLPDVFTWEMENKSKNTDTGVIGDLLCRNYEKFHLTKAKQCNSDHWSQANERLTLFTSSPGR